ncbi:MAG: hypothetical protein JNM33_01680 [Rubrivivax sp.]|nr:hypothetical protein [Rubrivivax sp.]
MNKFLFQAAGVAGLLALAWVAIGYLQQPLALAMTALIAAFYVAGVLELRRFDRATQGLQQALAALTATPPSLPGWLATVPEPLRAAVQARVAGERLPLPGPALAPMLAGLLVLLGMLGTFLGMVATLNGTGVALEHAGDITAMRDTLSAPVRGLGLAFGTSVAGVAGSAMLGLMSALSRRERAAAGQALDSQVASTLRPFTPAFQRAQEREAAFALQQQQAAQMPLLVERLSALMLQLEQQAKVSNDALLARQQQFHDHAGQAWRALAASVDQTLQRSLGDSARSAAATVQAAVEATMSGITRETAALHGHIAATVQQQLDGLAQRFEQQSGAWVDALGAQAQQQTTALLRSLEQGQARQQAEQASADEARLAAWSAMATELRGRLSDSLAHDNALLEERSRIMATLNTLLGAVQHTSTEQKAAIDALVAATARWLQEAGARFTERLEAETARLDAVSAQLTASAVDVASLGDAFGGAVELFSQTGGQMLAHLQRVEETLAQAATRSDEQLAYYVAQAREVIDLSLHAQKQVVDELQRLANRPAALTGEAA